MGFSIKLFVDFNNCDADGKVRLNTKGTFDDIKRSGIKLEPGMNIWLDDEDGLAIDGVVEYSEKKIFGWQNLIGIN
jgi:hypothetical protein